MSTAPKHLMHFEGGNALAPHQTAALLSKLQAIQPKINALHARFVHWVVQDRDLSADQVVARLRGRLAQVTGANLFMFPVQDIRVGGRQSASQYQFTLQADELPILYTWGPRIVAALQRGARHFVQKPVKPEVLYEVIKYVLGEDATVASAAGAGA